MVLSKSDSNLGLANTLSGRFTTQRTQIVGAYIRANNIYFDGRTAVNSMATERRDLLDELDLVGPEGHSLVGDLDEILHEAEAALSASSDLHELNFELRKVIRGISNWQKALSRFGGNEEEACKAKQQRHMAISILQDMSECASDISNTDDELNTTVADEDNIRECLKTMSGDLQRLIQLFPSVRRDRPSARTGSARARILSSRAQRKATQDRPPLPQHFMSDPLATFPSIDEFNGEPVNTATPPQPGQRGAAYERFDLSGHTVAQLGDLYSRDMFRTGQQMPVAHGLVFGPVVATDHVILHAGNTYGCSPIQNIRSSRTGSTVPAANTPAASVSTPTANRMPTPPSSPPQPVSGTRGSAGRKKTNKYQEAK